MAIYTRSNVLFNFSSALGGVDGWLPVVFASQAGIDTITATNIDGSVTRITGTGFELDAANVPTAGAISKIEHFGFGWRTNSA